MNPSFIELILRARDLFKSLLQEPHDAPIAYRGLASFPTSITLDEDMLEVQRLVDHPKGVLTRQQISTLNER